jgi:gamma-glutamylcyclotransferase (GGCT)/AIG2-like uncharacterized protein YtfP
MKIAIVGGAPSSAHLAPFNDPEWKIWVLGVRADIYPRIDKIFEIHEYLETDPEKHIEPVSPQYYQSLQKFTCPVVVADNCPFDHPNKQVFPYAEAEQMIGSTYLTSTCAYMMALAILEGATAIGLWGVDMSVDDEEYFYQRPCMEQWIGYAKGRGIEVVIPKESCIGKSTYVYGKNFMGDKPDTVWTEEELLKIAGQHQAKMDELEQQRAYIMRQIDTHNGSKQAYERLAKAARAINAGVKIGSLTHTALIK